MKKTILILGDSFVYGQGCSDKDEKIAWDSSPSKFCWPSLMSKDLYEYDIINIARPGNSLPGMFHDLLTHTLHSNFNVVMVIFAVTSFDRIMITNLKNPDSFSNWVLGTESIDNQIYHDYTLAKNLYFKHLINDEIIQTQALAYLSAIIHYIENMGIQFMYSTPHQVYLLGKNTWLSKYDHLRFLHQYEYKPVDNADPNFYLKCRVEDGHPNNLGHLLYYRDIIKPIVVSKIKESV